MRTIQNYSDGLKEEEKNTRANCAFTECQISVNQKTVKRSINK
jgi:hypothetical protein